MCKVVKFMYLVLILLFSLSFIGACEIETDQPIDEMDKLQVVVSLTIFEDMVEQVGGDKVVVEALVPVGVEPEDYEPTPSDVRALEDADCFIYNGLELERCLPQMVPDMEQKDNFHALAEDEEKFDTIPLPAGAFVGEPDPHLWTNVRYGKQYAQSMASILGKVDPDSKAYYQKRLLDYREELEELHSWIKQQVKNIPAKRRQLITSELCFQYFAAEYGFFHDAIWPINAPAEGTSSQIVRIVDVIEEREIPVVFLENQVDPRPMERVSREAGVPKVGELYSDSLSEPGEGGETYTEMMRSNTSLIVSALQEESKD